MATPSRADRDRVAQESSSRPVPLRGFANSDLPLLELLEVQGEIVDLMANGASLVDTLYHIATLVERLAPPALCSILLLQRDGKHLRPAAAPSLPEAYCQAIDGVEIGPCVGSCGTAAYTKRPVIVSDIATDPLWAGPRDFTLSFGLRACWSLPIMNAAGTVLGTIAMYYREPRTPTGHDWGLLEPASRLVRLALAQDRKEVELRESEARWHLAADATGLGTFDVDFITSTDAWSPNFKAILGLDNSIASGPQLFISLLHPDDRERFVHTFRPTPDPLLNATQNEELRIIRADTGEERIVMLRGRVLFGADGTATRAIGTMADINEQRRREQELAEAKLTAERANRAKSDFLAGMSHELRTPLNAIIGFSDVMQHGTFGQLTPPKYREYVDDIHGSGLHLLSLINDILDMAKIEAGKRELAPSDIDLAIVSANALRFVEAQAATVHIRLNSDIEGAIVLNADERAIMQILTNLLSNAVKFTEPGGQVTVFARRMATGGIALGVEDSGIGMTEQGIVKAIEPFGQIEQKITIEGRGTGLGLPIVKALIEAHGATFHIESVPGEGTRVWGEFPPSSVSLQATG